MIRALLAIYCALSVADLCFTYTLLHFARFTGREVTEANDVAAMVIEQGGWCGLAVFKVAVVAAFITCIVAIARKRGKTALCLACCGVLALSCVVVQSVIIIQQVTSPVEN